MPSKQVFDRLLLALTGANGENYRLKLDYGRIDSNYYRFGLNLRAIPNDP
jgi:hypothetical protein